VTVVGLKKQLVKNYIVLAVTQIANKLVFGAQSRESPKKPYANGPAVAARTSLIASNTPIISTSPRASQRSVPL